LVRRIDFTRRDQAIRQQQLQPIHTDRQQQVNVLKSAWVAEALDALDHTGSAFGIELRHPFFDKRLIEFCVALPVTQKIEAGWTRLILRRAMQNILPIEIQWRAGKSNLEPNFFKALITHDRPQIEQALFKAPTLLEPYVNIPTIQATYQRLLVKPTAAAAARVWSAAQLWYWIEQQ
jgi:asparagine synthase (glutamine-hydrolysing)